LVLCTRRWVRAVIPEAPRAAVLAAYSSINFPLSLMSLVLLVYVPPLYGELGIPLALLGTLLMVARLSDVLTDPLIGYLSDRTALAFGRRKPWVLAGAPLMMLSTWMLFVPPDQPDAFYFCLWVVLVYLAYTIMDLPYLAWGAELSDSYAGRSAITSWREQLGYVGKLAATSLPIVVAATAVYDMRSTVRIDALLVCLLVPLATAWALVAVPEAPRLRTSNSVLPLRRRMRVIFRNGPFVRILTGYTGSLVAGAMDGAISYFFCKHALQVESWFALALFLHLVAAVLGIPFWNAIGNRSGKHRALVFAILWYAGWAFCMPLLTLSGLPLWSVISGFVFLQTMKGFALGAFEALSASMAADVVELDTLRTGQQRAGVYFSVWGVVKKSAAAFAAFIALTGIGFFGFDATLDPARMGEAGGNSVRAILALTLVYSFVPSCFKLAVLPILWRYPLTAQRQVQFRARLQRKHARLAPPGA
jgi:Na+/melibiose symporter-like transporter